MTSIVIPSDFVKQSKTTEELARKGEIPPLEFIIKKNGPALEYSFSAPLVSIPVIDMSLFFSSSPLESEQLSNELEKLRSSSSTFGCFQIINHGISSSLLNKVYDTMKEFFSLPVEEKKKYSRDGMEGYGTDPIASKDQVFSWCDRLMINSLPESRRNLSIWPENPSNFREIVHEYSIKTMSVIDLLYKAMAKSLNLEEKSFTNQVGDQPQLVCRFNLSPPCVRPDLVHGVRPHTDRSVITTLVADKEGSQIMKDDKWVAVPQIPGAITILIGDQMEIMSNGIFKSVVHRAAAMPEEKGDRKSIALFGLPEKDKEIGVVDSLIDETRPRKYKNVTNFSQNDDAVRAPGFRSVDVAKT